MGLRPRSVSGALLVLTLAQASAFAAEPFEGVWARTGKECRDQDGPTSRTLIDLGNVIAGKPVPIFDQYENHCRIGRKTAAGGVTSLAATCFEFWEDFTKGVGARKVTIRLAPGPDGTLRIDGKLYRRCDAKRAAR